MKVKRKKRSAWIPRRDPWRNNMESREIPWTKVVGRLMVIGITVLVLALGSNFVLRSANMYQYTLDASQLLSGSSSVVKEEDVVKVLGDYMQHKSSRVYLMSNAEYNAHNVFDKQANVVMHRLRRGADVMAAAGIGALVLTVVCYFFLIRWRRKKEHMQYFRYTVIIAGAVCAGLALTKAAAPLYHLLWGRFFGGSPKDDVLISLIINQDFFRQEGIIELIVDAVLLAVFGYITWEIAGNKRLFKER